jgi:cell wall-associated NlpC family hydrolase
MPTYNRVQRALALPLVAALVSSGLLLVGSGAATAAPGSPSTVATSAPSALPATTVSPALKRKKARRNAKIRRAVRVSLHQIGDPYSYGSSGPGSFDCSGLTSYAFRKAGIPLPRTSGAQAGKVNRIGKRRMKRGDFVFYHSGGHVYHVGIFLKRKHGQRIIVHAPSTGSRVQRDPMWGGSWFAGTMRVRRH